MKTKTRVTWRYAEDVMPKPQRVILTQDCKEGSAILKTTRDGRFKLVFFGTCGKEVERANVWRWVYIEEIE
jgi:hypothetical protein